MKKFNLNILMALLLVISINVFTGCTKEAEAQVFSSKRLVNFGDTTLLSPALSDYGSIVVSMYDSSNSTTDTFQVYIVTPGGGEMLARMTTINDTTSTGYFKTNYIGTVIPGDGNVGVYKVNCGNAFKIKIRRTNVASISGTAVTGKVSVVSISAFRSSGYILDKNRYRKDYAFQNTELNTGSRNPGYY